MAEEETWDFPNIAGLKLYNTVFNGKQYIHLRFFKDTERTRHGVGFPPETWKLILEAKDTLLGEKKRTRSAEFHFAGFKIKTEMFKGSWYHSIIGASGHNIINFNEAQFTQFLEHFDQLSDKINSMTNLTQGSEEQAVIKTEDVFMIPGFDDTLCCYKSMYNGKEYYQIRFILQSDREDDGLKFKTHGISFTQTEFENVCAQSDFIFDNLCGPETNFVTDIPGCTHLIVRSNSYRGKDYRQIRKMTSDGKETKNGLNLTREQAINLRNAFNDIVSYFS